MEDHSLADNLRAILLQIESSRESIEKGHEKFQIALSGALRLLDDNNPMLEKLRGSPDDLKGFVLNLVAELSTETISHWESLHSQIEQILVNLPESHDRKS
ncbi:MAG: hypothetical protein ACFFAD_07440 [Candidatus Hermodarchaeota archaeon]